MSKYYLGRIVTSDKSWSVVPIKDLSEKEKNFIYKNISFAPFFMHYIRKGMYEDF